VTASSLPLTHDATAVVGRRIAAWFIDLLVYLALGFLFSLAFLQNSNSVKQYDVTPGGGSAFCTQWRETHNGFCFSSNDQATTVKVNASSFLYFGIHFLAYAVIQGLAGGSIGKLAVGLRVVTSDGQLCGVGRSFARTVLWVVDAVTFALPILGGILMLTTKGHRRLGDMAAGTYVVPKEAVGHPVEVPGLTAPMAGRYGPASTSSYPPYQAGPGPASDTNGPRWDPARNAYIQWDAGQNRWVQYDNDARQWKPIDT